jgi:2-dehydro-3-deoxygluconokinase
MLRLDPGDERISAARTFRAWEGGGEYNVARSLRKCFGLRTSIVTALADNPIGRLVEDLMLQGGVDTSHVKWVPYDGIGRLTRNGLNFTERGFGLRGPVGCSDRGLTAVSQLQLGEIDWTGILRDEGVRWLHTGGIFAGLSQTTAEVAEEALRAAHAEGAITSYDLNYRPSLWEGIGGTERAATVNRRLVSLVDILFGNEEDFGAALGYDLAGTDDHYSTIDTTSYASLLGSVVSEFPNLSVVAASLRTVRSASVNDWSAICMAGGRLIKARVYEGIEILDRIGGGDSFAAGVIFGIQTELTIDEALEFGVAHGALAMTTPGDTSMANLAEVQRLVSGGGARVRR